MSASSSGSRSEAEFSVTINSVLGVAVKNPEDALTVARRARSLGFHSTVGIAHDGAGQSHALPERQFSIYQEIRRLETGVFSFAHYDRFQENLVRGLPNAWHCRAGARFLYICEDGLVHWCSQQRGHPGIPLVDYKHEDIEQQYAIVKECAPFCGISCVQQTAMLDEIRENPRGMLQQLIERRRATDPNFRTPLLLRFIAWAFLENPRADIKPLSGCWAPFELRACRKRHWRDGRFRAAADLPQSFTAFFRM